MATAPAAPVSTAAVQRRPKDRKAQIVRAAARTFSQRGYHAVGVDEIAAEVGISGPALYRHFANKYALLVATAEYAAQALVTAARSADEQGRPPAERLRAMATAALIDATIGRAARAGLRLSGDGVADDHGIARARTTR